MKLTIIVLLAALSCAAQETTQPEHDMANCPMHERHQAAGDKHFEGVQQRGEAHEGMGFSQTETTHHFILTSDGGYIQVTANDPKDSASIEQIQGHFQHIAMLFAKGDFDIPHFVHDQTPPGVKTMQKLKNRITYTNQKLDDGAKLVISTKSAEAVKAVHEFLRFQITDHRTGDPLEVAAKD